MPEDTMRSVVDACSDCDVCRYLMDTSCLLFPELYRLFDKETETGKEITPGELRHLVDLCNFCALCPCPNIRADIIKAKTGFIERDGLPFGVRTLEDVERIGRLCGIHPGLANRFFRSRWTAGAVKKAMGIHPERIFPEFPEENFPKWAQRQKLNVKPNPGSRRKVAYFAGCTARHIFPEVPKAVVGVFEKNGIDLYYLEQQCCGMPTMLEGDNALTQKFVRFCVAHLAEAVEDGYAIVCSCPTCSYMLKTVLAEGAYYSPEYQESVAATQEAFKVPAEKNTMDAQTKQFVSLPKSIYGKILKDEGYFSAIPPLQRIRVAENTFDVGEYLANLHRRGELNRDFGPVASRIAYYPPCHLREQEIGRPYAELMGLIPGLAIDSVDWSHYCCGMAGIMGFKRDFHESSIRMGRRLMEKIKEIDPERLATDCLSCRLQFNQMTSYKVFHPIEILMESYGR